MKQPTSVNRNPAAHARHGVTLVEVLMSLMIMSIGVTSVAVLFPISMLRSIQATQLTNGAITKYNVETLLDMQPGLIFDPDGDYLAGPAAGSLDLLTEHFRFPATRNYIVDPAGFYTHVADGQFGYAGLFGNDPTGLLTPVIPRHGGGLHMVQGWDIDGSVGAPFIPATAAHYRALQVLGTTLAKQGDGWTTQIEAAIKDSAAQLISNGTGYVGIQLSSDLDLSQVPTSDLLTPVDGGGNLLIPDPGVYRIVIFNEDSNISQSFPLTYLDTGTNSVYWSEDTNADGTIDRDYDQNGIADFRYLPNEFLFDTDGDLIPDTPLVSMVRLESNRENQFTWMLNVRRRSDGLARSIDVIVRFANGVDPADERMFPATFVAGTPGVSSYQVFVANATDGTEPNIRKGKFIFDALNGVWYRIQDVQTKPLLATGPPWDTYDYIVTTETAIREAAGTDFIDDSTLNGSGTFAGAMFPTGIVDIYPMGSRNIPDGF
ncbi:MAG: prepilin-type N-terminal cleavage/methylation domain-containing protein [Planctomycetaceae bacterium]